MVQSKVAQDLFVNDHQPFPKCQVQIGKIANLMSFNNTHANHCLIFLFCLIYLFIHLFMYYLLQCDIPTWKQEKARIPSDLRL